MVVSVQKAILLGKTNVGKSTLFNLLTNKKEAIISQKQHTTRDLKEGFVRRDSKPYVLVDSSGFDESEELLGVASKKVIDYIKECDLVIFLVDIKSITDEDIALAKLVRKKHSNILFCANKVDHDLENETLLKRAFLLKLGAPHFVSCLSFRGLEELHQRIFVALKTNQDSILKSKNHYFFQNNDITIVIVGRPNVGKSSLMNALLKKEHALTSALSGTTRDTVIRFFRYQNKKIRLMDTSGMRRRSRKKEELEIFSLQKTIDSINKSDFAILVIEPLEGITDQDKKIASVLRSRHKPFFIVVNKWDLAQETTWKKFEDRVRFRFPHIHQVPIMKASCLDQKNVHLIFKKCLTLFKEKGKVLKTSQINQMLQKAVEHNPSTKSKKKGLKIYYGLQIEKDPLIIRVYINYKKFLTAEYIKYLKNSLMKEAGFKASEIEFEFMEKK